MITYHTITLIYVLFIKYNYNPQHDIFFQISSPLNFPPPLQGPVSKLVKIRYFFFKNSNWNRFEFKKTPNFSVAEKVLIWFFVVFPTFTKIYQNISMIQAINNKLFSFEKKNPFKRSIEISTMGQLDHFLNIIWFSWCVKIV